MRRGSSDRQRALLRASLRTGGASRRGSRRERTRWDLDALLFGEPDEIGARPSQPRQDGAAWALQDLGDRSRVEPLELVQDEHRALTDLELGDADPQPRKLLTVVGQLLRTDASVDGCRQRLGSGLPAAQPPSAALERAIDGDAEQPGPQSRVAAKTTDRLVRGDEDLLRHLFGVRIARHETAGEAVNLVAVLTKQLAIGGGMTRSESSDEQRIGMRFEAFAWHGIADHR